MKRAVAILFLLAAAGGLTPTYSIWASTNDCLNILFMGNSFTHGNSSAVTPYNSAKVHDFNGTGMGGVPAIFQKLATDGGRSNLAVNIEAVSGQTLAYHLANRSGVITNPGAYGPWDWVVLQDYSTRPTKIPGAGDVAGFRSNVQSLNSLATNNNPAVRTLLFCTWGRPDIVAAGNYPSIQSMQSDVTTNYSNAARDFNLRGYAPVGDAFMSAVASGLSINPNVTNTPGPGQINLWQFDNYHASTAGSFLAALVFYAKILGADPRSLPTGPGSAASDLGLNSNVVVQLQNIAYEMVLGPTNPVADFSFTVTPNAQTVTVGSNAAFVVTVAATNGFTGDVALNATGLPTNVSADFSPPFVTGSGTSTLTLTTSTNTPPGTYSLTVTGTGSNATHSSGVTLTINAPDFSVEVSPAVRTVTGGSNATYTVSVGSLFGFTGNVTLSVTGLPAGVSADFSPPSVTGSGTSTLSLATSGDTPPGTYSLTVTGTSSDATRTSVVALTISVVDFSVEVSPTVRTVTGGSNATYTVSVGSLFGFAGNVTLSVTGLPGGVSADFSPPSVTGSGTSTLSLATFSVTQPVVFPLTVTGASSNITHTALITLTLQPLDTDGDGIPDSWIQQYFGHPTGQASDRSLASQDAAGTGQNNLFKYIAGLDPTNPTSIFVLNIANVDNAPNLTFQPVAPGRTYTFQFTTDLPSGDWWPLPSFAGPVTNGNEAAITDSAATESNKFYRLGISLP